MSDWIAVGAAVVVLLLLIGRRGQSSRGQSSPGYKVQWEPGEYGELVPCLFWAHKTPSGFECMGYGQLRLERDRITLEGGSCWFLRFKAPVEYTRQLEPNSISIPRDDEDPSDHLRGLSGGYHIHKPLLVDDPEEPRKAGGLVDAPAALVISTAWGPAVKEKYANKVPPNLLIPRRAELLMRFPNSSTWYQVFRQVQWPVLCEIPANKYIEPTS